jgi:hypothetical protein
MRIEIVLEGNWANVLDGIATRLNVPLEDAVVYALILADTSGQPMDVSCTDAAGTIAGRGPAVGVRATPPGT